MVMISIAPKLNKYYVDKKSNDLVNALSYIFMPNTRINTSILTDDSITLSISINSSKPIFIYYRPDCATANLTISVSTGISFSLNYSEDNLQDILRIILNNIGEDKDWENFANINL